MIGVQFASPFEKFRVDVKYITRIGLSARWTSEQQAELTVRIGMFAKVIEDNQHIHALIKEILGHGHACIGCQVSQGWLIIGTADDHNGMRKDIFFSQSFND